MLIDAATIVDAAYRVGLLGGSMSDNPFGPEFPNATGIWNDGWRRGRAELQRIESGVAHEATA